MPARSARAANGWWPSPRRACRSSPCSCAAASAWPATTGPRRTRPRCGRVARGRRRRHPARGRHRGGLQAPAGRGRGSRPRCAPRSRPASRAPRPDRPAEPLPDGGDDRPARHRRLVCEWVGTRTGSCAQPSGSGRGRWGSGRRSPPKEYLRSAIGPAKGVSEGLSPCPRACREIEQAAGMAGGSAVSASAPPILRPGGDRPPPGTWGFPQFPQAICQWPVAWRGRRRTGRLPESTIPATGNSFAPHRGPEIDVGRGRVKCHRTMVLRKMIEASEHDADPVQVGLSKHTPQHCARLSDGRAIT